ncbi:Iron-sulfur clusters transporter atm1, mitochondrial [Elasticomyces elasticus]|nr:Iron-sulfur clusters transporter atm1, mitochondrial [Elasticomyces elasticus]KAK4992931.1 Iron-sulfur clusters transporter atm1, mitochondrial [Elasticomyces elasticus]
MLARRMLRSACQNVRGSTSPSHLLLSAVSRRHAPQRVLAQVFTTTPRHRKDDARIRSVQQEVAHKTEASESIKPESVQKEKPASEVKTDPLLSEQTVSNKEQRKADWAIIKDMANPPLAKTA